MKLTVNADQIPFIFTSLTEEQTQEPKKVFGTEEVKTDDEGNILYSMRSLQAVKMDDNGNPNGTDKSVSLNVRQPHPLGFLKSYVLVGNVTVTHYINNNRVAVSLTADSIKEVTATQPKES